jgi:hypothetical protein
MSDNATINIPDILDRSSATDLLRIAVSVCDARFGVARLAGHEAIATDSAVSCAEALLAKRAEEEPACSSFLASRTRKPLRRNSASIRRSVSV